CGAFSVDAFQKRRAQEIEQRGHEEEASTKAAALMPLLLEHRQHGRAALPAEARRKHERREPVEPDGQRSTTAHQRASRASACTAGTRASSAMRRASAERTARPHSVMATYWRRSSGSEAGRG